jgi:hypothetical protein
MRGVVEASSSDNIKGIFYFIFILVSLSGLEYRINYSNL